MDTEKKENIIPPVEDVSNNDGKDEEQLEKEKNKVDKGFEELADQQKKLIDTLLKQQEINNKANMQIAGILNEKKKENQDPYGWVDKILENVPFNAQFDKIFGTQNASQVPQWYAERLRRQGLSNKEIAHRLGEVFKYDAPVYYETPNKLEED